MTFRDDEIALPGNREAVERELTRSVAQVLLLVPGKAAGHRSLQEVGVEIMLSVVDADPHQPWASGRARPVSNA